MTVLRSKPARMSGFSLIEVMIALVVLAFGLLGLALLQTMNLRYTQSANQRTQAVNLAGELIDMMRSNRSELGAYAMTDRDMSGAPTPPCASSGVLGAATNISRWSCEVREALGPNARVQVDANATTGAVRVSMRWSDSNMAQSTNDTPLAGSGQVEMSTQL